MKCSNGTFFNEQLKHCVPEGFTPPECPANQCMNDADCIVDGQNNFHCMCRNGFTGVRCETNVDECALEGNAACAGGSCIDQINGYICSCPNNAVGLTCQSTIQNPCTEENLSRDNIFHAVPSPLQNTYMHCTGPSAFAVRRCAENLFWHNDEQTCSAERTPLRLNTGVCAMQQPCKNRATCKDDVNGGFKCECIAGYTGQICETEMDYCESNPCQNGGRCLRYPGGYTCVCQDKVIDGKKKNKI